MKLINVLVIVTYALVLATGCKKSVEKPPVVTTNAVTNISYTSAFSGGTIATATNITDKGLIWGIDSNMLMVTSLNKVSNGPDKSNFSDTIQNLQPNTNYYLRAYAVYNTGVSYGATIKFTTLPLPQPKVYVAGYDSTSAVYWKNDTMFTLSTNNAYAQSIYVVNNDVYVAGEVDALGYGNKDKAVYWKNGAEIPLTDGNNLTTASSIFVNGSDVYVAGYENNNNWPVAKYWKNGVGVSLTGGTMDDNGMAYSIYVDGSDVYVAGYTNNQGPVYWKNGVAVPLLDSNYDGGVAHSIFVVNKNVYVAGNQGSKVNGVPLATYWFNGISTVLPDYYHQAYGNSIYVNGNDVYVAGIEYGYAPFAIYWRNGIAFPLTDGSNSADANSICVNGNDVYVTGNKSNSMGYSQPIYWKNGSEITLKGSTKYAYANSIFVK